ncbi:hypothetical protein F5Y06DRAFT_295664 [Hypoxylon sp. FL0890]|nr:hypothetical protein F5Y06DRAFT_295664 [Hypoxylon sp. FL0890]
MAPPEPTDHDATANETHTAATALRPTFAAQLGTTFTLPLGEPDCLRLSSIPRLKPKVVGSMQGTWKQAFQAIIDTVPSEDASMECVRDWFYQIGALNGLAESDLTDLGRSAMLGQILRQAAYINVKDYLLSIADHNNSLQMQASLIAAEAYEAILLKKAMEVKESQPKMKTTKTTQT